MSSPKRFGPDPRITIPALRREWPQPQGLTQDRIRSRAQKFKIFLAKRLASTQANTKEQMTVRSYPSTAFRKWSRLIIKGFAFFMLLAAAIASYFGVMRLAGNFHTTIPGELYHSAQPTPSQLASYKKTYGIKTIVNLRGENSGRVWYDKEVTASSHLGIKHLDFRCRPDKSCPRVKLQLFFRS